MRIQIDKHTNHGGKPSGSFAWVISPGSGEASRREYDGSSYRIEVQRHDYSGQPDQIIRVAYRGGERFEFLPDDEFERNVWLVIENEPFIPEGVSRVEAYAIMGGAHFDETDEDAELLRGVRDLTPEEAAGLLNDEQNRWSYSDARTLGFDTGRFAEMEAAWAAANVFLDFGIVP